MTENPYDILGVPRDASLDEVKRAYRKKARENHPDLNPNDPAAAERMNKVNEAYDRITNPEKYARQDTRQQGAGAPYSPGYRGYGPTGAGGAGGSPGADPSGNSGPYGQGSPYDYVDFGDFFGGAWAQTAGPIHPEEAASDSAEVRQAVRFINAANYDASIGILSNITSAGRNARWYYLSAIANNGAGNTVQALDHIRRARQMDPNNGDYAHAERTFTQRATTYQQEGSARGFSTGFIDPTTLCCCLCFGPALCQPLMFCL